MPRYRSFPIFLTIAGLVLLMGALVPHRAGTVRMNP